MKHSSVWYPDVLIFTLAGKLLLFLCLELGGSCTRGLLATLPTPLLPHCTMTKLGNWHLEDLLRSSHELVLGGTVELQCRALFAVHVLDDQSQPRVTQRRLAVANFHVDPVIHCTLNRATVAHRAGYDSPQSRAADRRAVSVLKHQTVRVFSLFTSAANHERQVCPKVSRSKEYLVVTH